MSDLYEIAYRHNALCKLLNGEEVCDFEESFPEVRQLEELISNLKNVEDMINKSIENVLNYYLNLDYKIEVDEIPDDKGGGYIARLPQFGSFNIIGDGKTVEEALKNLEITKKIVFKEYLKKGEKIPFPS